MAASTRFSRYAIYAIPEGPLGVFGAAWLGWDCVAGQLRAHPPVTGLTRSVSDLTDRPRKYGFHGTIKPPFRLAPGQSVEMLDGALARLARMSPPVELQGLTLAALGRFLALVPVGHTTLLAHTASTIVRELDRFRAAPSEAEIARRNPDRLNPRQAALLRAWGYPFVMEEFRFHLTLTGPLDTADLTATQAALTPYLADLLAGPHWIDSLCLCGEGDDGRFHLIERHPLTG